MGEKKSIRVEQKGHIAYLILDRPEKHNAMLSSFFDEMAEQFKRFDKDPSVYVVVIKAEGKNFTAGLDLKEAAELLIGDGTGAAARENLRVRILELQEGFNWIEKCRKPVIAAAHGFCIGGGIDMMSACDIRLANRNTIFSIKETRIAIIADVGTLQRLPHIIGQGWYRELALTGRDFSAEDALKMGFITHLCDTQEDLYQRADEIAQEIAACAPLTVQGVKDVMNYSRDNGVYQGLEYVAQKNAASVMSDDLTEAFTAFLEKRPPKFKGN
ncbi:MAG: crotonase/enoyl-CoA hydratase family protein [Deltaproteobacteria bacterium]|jgi:enoyl-CoA hydratase/carnithine racemase|nr:crotonase/enoyl-CoA hydratase family protein [Deltaproteobacteria bacterium]MBT4088000.1 crotonase/enoyl-CoA hydratase family protein [Deltaproteobacteria bacterium]MBT4264249.1 crotonase/enoyl-CoA hydratase family protein [Deltaproteobacteria bacterium]MBT4638352.1 crotonase/enoyl-CoA hydratase family protein [Deltaproteobacteria bacterium]MBT6499946.1 crotonase/enoyl-CoA hydratase family protein [Deltaproteobacteria bacterium]